ncbi:MAG TPA: helix-turn-helix transcriptional regulator [Lacipirellulaceae bacterium]
MISLSKSTPGGSASAIAVNLRRLMARHGLTFDDVVRASGLDERTVRGLARGLNNPHARTLTKLAAGLGVEVDELFHQPGQTARQRFDRATNMLVESVVAAHGDIFDRWTDADFNELYSRFGTGGQLTEAGVLAAAEAMNGRRELWRQISIILETGEATLLAEFIQLLYRRATAAAPKNT